VIRGKNSKNTLKSAFCMQRILYRLAYRPFVFRTRCSDSNRNRTYTRNSASARTK